MTTWQKIAAGVVILVLLAAAGWWLVAPAPGKSQDESLETLVRELHQPVPAWQRVAGRILRAGRIKNIFPGGWLRKLDQSMDRSIEDTFERQSKSLYKLEKGGTNTWPAVPLLVQCLYEDDIGARIRAAWVLGRVGAERHPEWPALAKSLAGQERPAEAFRFIAGSGGQQRADFTPTQLRFAIMGLTACGRAGAPAGPALLELLGSSSEPDLRAAVVIALSRTSGYECVPLFKRLLADEREWPQVSGAAAEALAFALPADPQTSVLLRSAMKDTRALVRLSGAISLWRLHAPAGEVLPVMTGLLGHRLPSIRVAALKTLQEVGPAAQPARPAMQPLVTDMNASVRRAAADCLKATARGRSE